MFRSLVVGLLLAGQASAQATDPEAANINARLQLAAVNAPGDSISDAVLARVVDMQRSHASSMDIDPALLQALGAAHERLQARTDARMRDEPVLLATFSGCFWKKADPAQCKGASEDLARLAGDNGYYHFVLMSDAGRRGDDEAFSLHALDLLAAPEYKPDFQRVFSSLHARYRQVPDALWIHEMNRYGAATAGVQAMSIAAAVALPAYQQFMRACKESEGEKRRLCVLVARRMAAESPLIIDRTIAFDLLEKLGDARDQAQADEHKRQLNWLVQGAAAFDEKLGTEMANTYFDLFSSKGEIAALKYASQAMGRTPEPPSDWQR